MKQVVLLVSILFVAAVLYVVFMPPRPLTLKDLQKDPLPYYDQSEQDTIQSQLADSVSMSGIRSGVMKEQSDSVNIQNVTAGPDPIRSQVKNAEENIVHPDGQALNKKPEYYIIIESCKSISLARQRAAKLREIYNADIFALPPTPDGKCRISYGRYASMDDARLTLNSLKAEIGPGIWIYSLK